MKKLWAKMPSRWVMDRGLRGFSAKAPGENSAALKVYMAIAMEANFEPTQLLQVAGVAKLSFSQLEDLCGLSRQSVAKGIAVLKERDLIAIHEKGYPHAYLLTGYTDLGWAKIPRAHLLAENRFRDIPIRGVLPLDALKLYLAIATFRSNKSPFTLLSYDKIEDYTAVPRPRIRRAIDVLLNHDLISLTSRMEGFSPGFPGGQHGKPPSAYVLRGDLFGRGRQMYVPSAAEMPGPADIGGVQS